MFQACRLVDAGLGIIINAISQIMGPSGSGKTSLLRAMAGLWRSGKGKITFYLNSQDDLTQEKCDSSGKRSSGDILFLPQRPYMVLGTLRQQLLYPAWSTSMKVTPGGSKIDGTRLVKTTYSI